MLELNTKKSFAGIPKITIFDLQFDLSIYVKNQGAQIKLVWVIVPYTYISTDRKVVFLITIYQN